MLRCLWQRAGRGGIARFTLACMRSMALPEMVFLKGSTKPVLGLKWMRCFVVRRIKYSVCQSSFFFFFFLVSTSSI